MASQMICTERRGYTFITGQLGASERLFRSRECLFFKRFLTISDRVDCSQLESAGGTRGQQDGFQPTAGDRGVRSG